MTDVLDGTQLEYGLFGLCFRQEGAIAYFDEHLAPDCVGVLQGHTGFNQFYLALLDFYRRTGLDPVDPIAFQSWLDVETEIADALGGAVGVKVFLDVVCGVDLPSQESVVGILKYRANKRRQLDALQELQLLVTKKDHKSEYDDSRVTFLTDQIRALEHEVGYDPLANVTRGGDIAERAEAMWELPDFLPTQFPMLNRALGYDHEKGGFIKGAVHAILAASGQGKSTLSKCLMNHWVDQGHTVLYVNYEEASSIWERTLFIQVTKCNIYAAAHRKSIEKDYYNEVFRKTMKEDWGDRFIVRHDPDTPYFEDLEQWLRDILGHNEQVPDVVIIDTIQSMFTKGGSGKPRWGQYEEMMVRLEKLAKDMHCVLIITAQENTNRMKDKREVVQQSDAGGSISIVQKSTVTIHITPKRLASHDDAEDECVMQLQIPKNRITGTRFNYDPPLVRYDDDTKSYYPHGIEIDDGKPTTGVMVMSSDFFDEC